MVMITTDRKGWRRVKFITFILHASVSNVRLLCIFNLFSTANLLSLLGIRQYCTTIIVSGHSTVLSEFCYPYQVTEKNDTDYIGVEFMNHYTFVIPGPLPRVSPSDRFVGSTRTCWTLWASLGTDTERDSGYGCLRMR